MLQLSLIPVAFGSSHRVAVPLRLVPDDAAPFLPVQPIDPLRIRHPALVMTPSSVQIG